MYNKDTSVKYLWARLFKFGGNLWIAPKKIDHFLNTFYPGIGIKETLSLWKCGDFAIIGSIRLERNK